MPDKRASEYYAVLQWLEDCGLVSVCPRCLEASGILAGMIDMKRSNACKVYPLDIGLRLAECGYATDFLLHATGHNDGILGKIIEQFVYQQLYIESRKRAVVPPAYYSWQYRGGQYEIDFMIDTKYSTIPVEVKSTINFDNAIYNQFKVQFSPEKMVRISMRNPEITPPLWSLPVSATQSFFDFLEINSSLNSEPTEMSEKK